MTSGLVLNELDLDLSPSGFLVGLGLILFFIVVCTAVARFVVLNETIVAGGRYGAPLRVECVETLSLV